jgi:hypothetical protein
MDRDKFITISLKKTIHRIVKKFQTVLEVDRDKI